MKLAPTMEASGEVVWFFPSEGAAQLPDGTTVKLHKMLNINLTKAITDQLEVACNYFLTFRKPSVS